ncbi:16S rRNA (cytidine(1402)-2'-O)-methyltransferase [Rarobacter faecitabidus]|uniref:Ribosomal RNA small subunit methyltransferase I n=1 Tax=Rarobacter faecitabidus TaxID=13243 RepID=A0A542ZTW7_RARFA|nr:16S rRNA (cytidine(1402)-2'-O)-methyltransferase [Rarobacter faecitabidus]TQL63795.1 16S rRNA (cytidine1402-2'-O)-methyltransferase [Rarobacter faecitabidus]
MAEARIVLAATPIGNSRDASARLVELLATADVIAAEDTRKVRDLARRLGVAMQAELISHHEHNERDRVDALLDSAEAGKLVVVVSDAGMPTVSDPGFPLVAEAARRGVALTVAPGPSAVLTALALSGLPTDRFTFEGFLPRKEGDRRKLLAALADEARTMVFFESPHRIDKSLADMAAAFGADRAAAVCRELTKTYEEVLRGEIGALVKDVGTPRGEYVIVVSGATREQTVDLEQLARRVLDLVADGVRLKEAASAVAEAAGAAKRDVYEAALAARGGSR